MFEQNYRRLKHFIWLWGTTYWKSACIIADTGVQLTSHWRCLFITACYCMSKLFWRCHALTGAAEHWVCLLWEYCCFALRFRVLCAGMRCKARTALDNTSVPGAQLEHNQHGVEQKWGCENELANPDSAAVAQQWKRWVWWGNGRFPQLLCGAELFLWRTSCVPLPRWPRQYSRLCKSFDKLGITFGLVLVNSWVCCCKDLGNWVIVIVHIPNL